MRALFAVAVLTITVSSAQTPDLKSIHKVFIDKLANDLDQYLRAEFSKQMNGKVVVVLDEKDADGILDRRERGGKRNWRENYRALPWPARHRYCQS